MAIYLLQLRKLEIHLNVYFVFVRKTILKKILECTPERKFDPKITRILLNYS